VTGFRQTPLYGNTQHIRESLRDGTLALSVSTLSHPLCIENPNGTPASTDWCTLLSKDPVPELFSSCPAPQSGISEKDLSGAAVELGVDTASIVAVAEVESKQAAFDHYGRPTILFERHYFHELTKGVFSRSNPDLSSSSGGGYGKFTAQYAKLQRAYQLSALAALQSCSWGRFQIMGKNYAECGFSTPVAFVRSHMRSEAAQLSAFVRFVANDSKKLTALVARDWAKFARLYNGPNYSVNKYDEKMDAAYERLTAEAKK
jgi:hypothetical protein